MLRYLFLILLFQYCNISIAQKWDYQWLFGYGEGQDERFGISKLDFNNKKVTVSYYKESKYITLGYTGSIIDDKYGNIKLITNNCDVRDAYWNVISGDSLITSTGDIPVEGCSYDSGLRYSAEQSSLFLPDLLDSTIVYLVTKDFEIDFEAQDGYSNNMYFYSIADENGVFSFERKKRDSTRNMLGWRLTACPNRKKDKWWILMPKNNSNVFKKVLVGDNEMVELDSQSLGLELKTLDLDGGQAQYSPNGGMIGFNSKHGIMLYDFNNETGELSNFRKVPYPNSDHVALGLCFSPNSQFIYVTTAEDVYQIDLENDNEIYHVGKFRSFDGDNWPVGLGVMFTGPDCKIYVSPGSTTYYMHVILNPNEKGAECKFIERAIELPSNIPHNLPNLPQYRYLTGCDTSIVFPSEKLAYVEETLLGGDRFTIYPNPAQDYIELVLTKMDRWHFWQIIDLTGRIISKGKYNDMQKIDISCLKSGMYILKMTDKEGMIGLNKFLVE